MFKVIVADDEDRIVRLIGALIDWNAMDLEIVATAYNGIDALEQIGLHQPHILITDIRMPGCDGLELISRAKALQPELEIIIISGYAHFPYAQTAMKFGVSDYLLKPINKNDLLNTLQRLKETIVQRQALAQDVRQLIAKDQTSKSRMKSQLAQDLLAGHRFTSQQLQESYDFHISSPMLQSICIKLDYEMVSDEAIKVVYEKAIAVCNANLKSVTTDLVLNPGEQYLYGFLNYPPQKQGDIKRIFRDCLNQLVSQKSILGNVEFTAALGFATKDAEALGDSLKQAVTISQERIVLKTECLLDVLPAETGLKDQNLMEHYMRQVTHALETFNQDEAVLAAQFLQDFVLHHQHIRGFEVAELVHSAGTMFVMQAHLNNRDEVLTEFQRRCLGCGSIQSLFQQLERLQQTILDTLAGQRDSEALRPIRLAKQYIQNHYNEAITLEQVSDIVGLSPTYFSALFKKETGEGFAKFLISVRVERAKVLLRESNLSISAICKEVGYNDIKHFNQTFEKACQVKPSVYRKLYG